MTRKFVFAVALGASTLAMSLPAMAHSAPPSQSSAQNTSCEFGQQPNAKIRPSATALVDLVFPEAMVSQWIDNLVAKEVEKELRISGVFANDLTGNPALYQQIIDVAVSAAKPCSESFVRAIRIAPAVDLSTDLTDNEIRELYDVINTDLAKRYITTMIAANLEMPRLITATNAEIKESEDHFENAADTALTAEEMKELERLGAHLNSERYNKVFAKQSAFSRLRDSFYAQAKPIVERAILDVMLNPETHK